MTIDEVEEQIRLHAQSARRIKEAGFDGVEICGAMGYLISSFLCKLTNKRTDKYGGTLENRARFFLEIIEKVRKEVGSDYPILIRMNAIDLMEGGNTEEEYVEIGKMCEAVTADFISLTIGWHESTLPAMTSEIKAGNWLYLAKKWKDAEIKVPLGISYRLNKPEVADKAMADGIIDYWEMCRPMIADPYIPKKVAEGRPEDIVICPACNMGCFTRVFSGATMSCMLNPRVGKEWDEAYQIKPVERKKKILVVGGGPAGMESARVAALKGHKVTLCERGGKLGGQMRLASKTPMLDDWNDIIRYYSTQLAKAGVDVRLGKQITADLINEENPDVLILATGAKSVVPEIAGTERENVATVFDALEGKVAVGNKVAILGGYEIGVQTAELLASQGKDVTIVEEGKRIGRDINIFNLLSHRRKLTELKVKMLANAKIKMITDAGVVIENSKSGKEETIAADTIVATAVEANKELLDALGFTTEVEEIYSIGDCVAPRKGYNAIHDGFRVGIKV
jgi:2,4-dienoyl-CoA reductase (NADPH2)